MVQRISGPGLGLPLPQSLYPSELPGAAQDFPGNRVTLAAGDCIAIPPGEWLVGLGSYLLLQFLDPITGTWVTGASGGWASGTIYIFSDGYNVRLANLLACPVGGIITAAGGGGYVQASTTISVTGGGGSTWQPIVGGQLAVSGATLVSSGAGYGIAPIAFIPPPPTAVANVNGVGGVSASGYFTISSGTVSGFTFTNPGAGYPAGLTITAQPSPYDPNLATGITLATIAFTTTAAGSLTGVLCTNSGAPLSNPANITLTVAGVGTNATVTAIVLQSVITASVSGGGTGYGTSNALLTTVGGEPGTAVFSTDPNNIYLAGRPRPAQVALTITGTGTIATQLGTVYDGGFFYALPTPIILPGMQAGAAGSIAGPTIVLTMGSRPDIGILQPAP